MKNLKVIIRNKIWYKIENSCIIQCELKVRRAVINKVYNQVSWYIRSRVWRCIWAEIESDE